VHWLFVQSGFLSFVFIVTAFTQVHCNHWILCQFLCL